MLLAAMPPLARERDLPEMMPLTTPAKLDLCEALQICALAGSLLLFIGRVLWVSGRSEVGEGAGEEDSVGTGVVEAKRSASLASHACLSMVGHGGRLGAWREEVVDQICC